MGVGMWVGGRRRQGGGERLPHPYRRRDSGEFRPLDFARCTNCRINSLSLMGRGGESGELVACDSRAILLEGRWYAEEPEQGSRAAAWCLRRLAWDPPPLQSFEIAELGIPSAPRSGCIASWRIAFDEDVGPSAKAGGCPLSVQVLAIVPAHPTPFHYDAALLQA